MTVSGRDELLRRATLRVKAVLEQGNSGANRNPEKAQFIAPLAGFTSFSLQPTTARGYRQPDR